MSGWGLALLHALVVISFAALAVVAGGRVVGQVFAHIDRRSALPGEANQGIIAAAAHLRGGTWIGALERLAIYAGLMRGYPEAIAICLAMKGLARYPELKAPDTGAAERFIIGTFTSVLWACACAGSAVWLNGQLR